jgi:hypothetical protein
MRFPRTAAWSCRCEGSRHESKKGITHRS